jgi:hypothetical protein
MDDRNFEQQLASARLTVYRRTLLLGLSALEGQAHSDRAEASRERMVASRFRPVASYRSGRPHR